MAYYTVLDQKMTRDTQQNTVLECVTSREEELVQLRTLTQGGLDYPGTRGTPLLFKHEERKDEWVRHGVRAEFCKDGQAFPHQAVHLLARAQQDRRALFQKAEG